MKPKYFCTTKKKFNKMIRQPMEGEKISSNHIFNRGSISKIYKIHTTQQKKRKKTQFKSGQKTWIDIFPKKIYRWPTETSKSAQRH